MMYSMSCIHVSNKSDEFNKAKIKSLKATICKRNEKLSGKRENSYKKIVTLK